LKKEGRQWKIIKGLIEMGGRCGNARNRRAYRVTRYRDIFASFLDLPE